jgi:hypothetical protein
VKDFLLTKKLKTLFQLLVLCDSNIQKNLDCNESQRVRDVKGLVGVVLVTEIEESREDVERVFWDQAPIKII